MYIKNNFADLDIDIDSPEQKEAYQSEWNELVSKLKLKGQELLPTEEIPYTVLKQWEQQTLSFLSTVKASTTAYSKTVIPLTVLRELPAVVDLFDKIEVWANEILEFFYVIGHLNNTYSSPLYIIARWGRNLSLPQLREIAEKKWLEDKVYEGTKRIRIAEISAKRYFDGDWVDL